MENGARGLEDSKNQMWNRRGKYVEKGERRPIRWVLRSVDVRAAFLHIAVDIGRMI
jgi:hypothetical protein